MSTIVTPSYQYKTRSSELKGLKRQFYRTAVLARLGAFCKECGFSDIRALQVDHIDGGKVGHCVTRDYKYWLTILEDQAIEDKFQVLCANHNWIKREVNNENNLHRILSGVASQSPLQVCGT